ncbi:Uncharacterised protein [Vibrio cholerae]|nr:Uncharacterised protein [Vibrio cholerae]
MSAALWRLFQVVPRCLHHGSGKADVTVGRCGRGEVRDQVRGVAGFLSYCDRPKLPLACFLN